MYARRKGCLLLLNNGVNNKFYYNNILIGEIETSYNEAKNIFYLLKGERIGGDKMSALEKDMLRMGLGLFMTVQTKLINQLVNFEISIADYECCSNHNLAGLKRYIKEILN